MAKHSASNEQEAATALRQAESMMRKHDVKMAELESAKAQSEDDMFRAETEESRNSRWVWSLAWAAAYMTETLPWKRGNTILFCGTSHDNEVAMMYFDYLVSVVERLAKQFDGDRSMRNAFKMGCVHGILKNARAIKAEREEAFKAVSTGKDLVVVKRDLISKKFNLSYGRASSYTIRDGRSYAAGKSAGSNVSLNRQVGSSSQQRLAS
tara:strand:+ start:664 stop:1290 length:627 start_codon:yes stop_codon:yes gene_type:complete